jgi:septation ring formation regulator EzrA
LNHWHEKASALSEAQLRSHQFSEKVTSTYQMLNDETAARAEVLRAVASAQEQLSALQQQLTDIADP